MSVPMGVTVNWDEKVYPSENSILQINYNDPWTWDDFYDAMNQVDSFTASRSTGVNFINDFTNSSTLPPSNLNHLSDFVRTLEEVGGMHVIVAFGALWESLQLVISNRSPHMGNRIMGSTSLEEARNMLTMKLF